MPRAGEGCASFEIAARKPLVTSQHPGSPSTRTLAGKKVLCQGEIGQRDTPPPEKKTWKVFSGSYRCKTRKNDNQS
jgi:hypothetical protein